MDAETIYSTLAHIALVEYPTLTNSICIIRGPLYTPKSLRIFLCDNSFVEVWLSGKKYSYHWQSNSGKIYRHDNAPHKKHRHLKTFPKHFHKGKRVIESSISANPKEAIKEFLDFIQQTI